MDIKTGDWIVTCARWRIEAREAIKVTSKLVFWKSEHSDHTFRVRLDEVVFAGPKDRANLLAQQLTSSFALMNDEQRSAQERREKRDEKLIQVALNG